MSGPGRETGDLERPRSGKKKKKKKRARGLLNKLGIHGQQRVQNGVFRNDRPLVFGVCIGGDGGGGVKLS